MTWQSFKDGFWCGLNPLVSIAWLLYGIGHLLSLALIRCDSAFWCWFWYAPYNMFMGWSVKVQGGSKCGPWRTP